MKTAEEILKSHRFSENCIVETEWEELNYNQKFVKDLMEEYAAQFRQPDAVGRSEQFVCPNGCGQNGDAGSCLECIGNR